MSDFIPLEKIYTLAEASERLRLNKNALARLARRTGHCAEAGRKLLFSETDLSALWQEMRVPKGGFLPLAHSTSGRDFFDATGLEAFLGPNITVDKRVIGVLQWLSTQRMPKTSAQIDRCGPRTIDELLRKNLVRNCGEDGDGQIKVAITPAGRKEVKTYERWLEKRKGGRTSR